MPTVVLTATSASPQTWVVPADCPAGTVVTVETWGAGSGASGGSTSFRAGGAGGAYASRTYTITAADVSNGIAYLLDVGSAGTAAANPANGTSTYFGGGNLIPNTTNAGANTSPSTLPTGWSTGQAAGLTWTVTGFGADDGAGRAYIDMTCAGTATATTATLVDFCPGGITTVNAPAIPNAAYIASAWLSLTVNSGTTPGSPVLVAGSYGANGSNNTAFINAVTTATAMTGTPTQFTRTVTAGAAATDLECYWKFTPVASTAYNFTIRIAGAQLESGSSATAWAGTPPMRYVFARGGFGASGTTGGIGGTANSCSPTSSTAFNGGSGATHTQGGGGGGAAGKDGAGASSTTGTGATGDNGSGGAANTSNVEGGGGATAGNPAGTPGDPGGGAAANTSTGSGSTGGRGQIRLTYPDFPRPLMCFLQMQPILAQ